MRYPISVALALFASSALAGSDPMYSVRRFTESQSLTRAAPTAACDAAVSPEGMLLDTVRATRIMLEAPSGQTLTGGTLRAYYYDWSRAAWFRNAAGDLTVTSGLARQVWNDVPVYVRTGCVLYAADSVTLSGAGTAVQVSIAGWIGAAW
jgi:hypothetical protein